MIILKVGVSLSLSPTETALCLSVCVCVLCALLRSLIYDRQANCGRVSSSLATKYA